MGCSGDLDSIAIYVWSKPSTFRYGIQTYLVELNKWLNVGLDVRTILEERSENVRDTGAIVLWSLVVSQYEMWLYSRSKLIQKVFKMKDDLASMQGVTQERAYELVTTDNIDDLLEEVLKGERSSATLYDICPLARLRSSLPSKSFL